MFLFYIIIGIFIIIGIIKLLQKKSDEKHENFVNENSLLLKRVKEINKEYSFYPYKNMNETHCYDNENFYDNITCTDYLIYQLQYKKSNIIQQINYMKFNRSKYVEYIKRINELELKGKYAIPINNLDINKLSEIEKEKFNQIKLKPCIIFSINVELYFTNIYGKIYDSKECEFNEKDIINLIERINNKNGTFYNDREIWDAICRVERGRVSNKMRFAVYERDEYRCRCCGKSGTDIDLEIDHIKPIAKGGKSTMDNLQTLCKKCNKEKGIDYIRY